MSYQNIKVRLPPLIKNETVWLANITPNISRKTLQDVQFKGQPHSRHGPGGGQGERRAMRRCAISRRSTNGSTSRRRPWRGCNTRRRKKTTGPGGFHGRVEGHTAHNRSVDRQHYRGVFGGPQARLASRRYGAQQDSGPRGFSGRRWFGTHMRQCSPRR